ncbi:MAG: roadblock/LC7 domain-containing protein [Actinobacteria bacterium]|nr:roadblock/LC7 domain-containing protein [Actinomycetota bacterium]
MAGKNDWDFPEVDGDFTLIDDLDILDTADFEIIELDSKDNVSKNGENAKKDDFVSILEEDSTLEEKENVIEPSTIIDENLEEEIKAADSYEVEKESVSIEETDATQKTEQVYENEGEIEEFSSKEEEMVTTDGSQVEVLQNDQESVKNKIEAEQVSSLEEKRDEEENEYYENLMNQGDEMVTKFKQEEINNILRSFLEVSPDFQAAAIVSSDGFVIASDLPEGSDESKLGAMSAAIISLGERASKELEKGNLETVFVEGANGYVLLSYITEDMLLVVSTSKYAKLGLVFYELSSLKKTLKGLFD